MQHPDGVKKDLAFNENDLLFSILELHAELPKTGHCLGNRMCGKCKVVVTKGPKKERTRSEVVFLGDASDSTHLACDLRLTKDFDGAVLELDP
jgi:ferredoxin